MRKGQICSGSIHRFTDKELEFFTDEQIIYYLVQNKLNRQQNKDSLLSRRLSDIINLN